MRRIEAAVLRAPTTDSFSIVAYLTVVCGLFALEAGYFLCVEPRTTIALDFRLQLGLLATLGLTALTWVTLHAFGFVGAGTGAGIRLAALGFAARMWVTLCVAMTGGETSGSIYDRLPEVTGSVWWVRHLSLVAYGCGIALVVLASAADLVRRRDTSIGTTFHD